MFTEGFIKEIERLSRAGQAPQAFRPSGMPDHQILVRSSDGGVELVKLDELPRNHVVSDLESLCKLCAENCGDLTDDDTKPVTNRPELWFSRDGVELVIHAPGDRRDRASFGLTYSPQLVQLQNFEQYKSKMTQKELIRILRVTFKKALAGDFLDTVRRIQMATNLSAEEQQTRRNIGRAAEATLGGGKEVPNELTFNVPVFAEGALADYKATVDCVLELDLDGSEPKFSIIPMAGEVEAAVTRVEVAIGARLSDLMLTKHLKKTPEDYGLYLGDHVEPKSS